MLLCLSEVNEQDPPLVRPFRLFSTHKFPADKSVVSSMTMYLSRLEELFPKNSSIVGRIVATYSSAVITGDDGPREFVLGNESFAMVTEVDRPRVILFWAKEPSRRGR